jgi:hypothetical protein
MGVATIGSVAFTGKLSLNIDFGITVDQIHADGEIWPSTLDVTQQLSRITISGLSTAQIKASGGFAVNGKAATQANSNIYFRKRENGGYNSGSVHIKATFAGLAYVDDVFDASGNEKATCSLVVLASYDGTNAPIVLSTGNAL